MTPGESIHGPALANADINANPTISKAITLLDSRGSTVSLGTVQILPIADSLIYVRPLYVSSSQTPFPQLVDVVVVYGKDVSMESTLGGALAGIFGSAPASTGPQGKGTGAKSSLSQVARQDIAQAVSAYQAAQAALARGDLGSYQQDVTRAGTLLGEANALGERECPRPRRPRRRSRVPGPTLARRCRRRRSGRDELSEPDPDGESLPADGRRRRARVHATGRSGSPGTSFDHRGGGGCPRRDRPGAGPVSA